MSAPLPACRFDTNFGGALGGAVDIVAVRQRNGSVRTTPFYVRFGKFQGVLKSKERVVRIDVNGESCGVEMAISNSGEAYFVEDEPPSPEEDPPAIDKFVSLEWRSVYIISPSWGSNPGPLALRSDLQGCQVLRKKRRGRAHLHCPLWASFLVPPVSRGWHFSWKFPGFRAVWASKT